MLLAREALQEQFNSELMSQPHCCYNLCRNKQGSSMWGSSPEPPPSAPQGNAPSGTAKHLAQWSTRFLTSELPSSSSACNRNLYDITLLCHGLLRAKPVLSEEGKGEREGQRDFREPGYKTSAPNPQLAAELFSRARERCSALPGEGGCQRRTRQGTAGNKS